MTEVLRASVELPTVVFTAILGIVGCLWLLSLVGLIDVDIDGADGLVDDALEPLNLSDVPATVLLTIFGLAGWFASVLASIFLLDTRSGTALAVWSVAVGALAAIVGLLMVIAIAPLLGRLFVTQSAPSKRDLLGRVAEVRSSTVTETAGRGEATWPDGTVSTVDLRVAPGTDVVAGEFRRGDRVLLVEWDEDTDDFFISRLPSELID